MSDQPFPELGTLAELEAYALALQAVHGWHTDDVAWLALETLGLVEEDDRTAALWKWLDPTVDPDSAYWDLQRRGGGLDMTARRRNAEQAFEEWKHDI